MGIELANALDETLTAPAQDAAFYRNLLDALADGVYFVDCERKITYWNRAAERIAGYARQGVIGRGCFEDVLVHSSAEGCQLCHVACPLSATLKDGTTQASDVFMKHKEGHRIPVSLRTSPIHGSAGEIAGAFAIFSDNSAKLDAIEKARVLEQLALLDPLTGVGNRRLIDIEIQRFQAAFVRDGDPFAILFLDMDRFKQINDRHGHGAGDAALRMAAKTIANSIRCFDFVGRWGGEEFIVLLANVNEAEAAAIAERCRALIESCRLDWGDRVIRTTASIGVGLSQAGDTAGAIIERADRKLYAAKGAGRNCVAGPQQSTRPVT